MEKKLKKNLLKSLVFSLIFIIIIFVVINLFFPFAISTFLNKFIGIEETIETRFTYDRQNQLKNEFELSFEGAEILLFDNKISSENETKKIWLKLNDKESFFQSNDLNKRMQLLSENEKYINHKNKKANNGTSYSINSAPGGWSIYYFMILYEYQGNLYCSFELSKAT